MQRIYIVLTLIIAFLVAGPNFCAQGKVKKHAKRTAVTPKKKNAAAPKNEQPATTRCELDLVTFSYQNSTCLEVASVTLKRDKSGKVIMTTRGTATDDVTLPLSNADAEELMCRALEIIKEEDMLDYAPSYSTKHKVMDGYFWDFEAQLADGTNVESHGSNAGPAGNGRSRLRSLLFDKAEELLNSQR